MTIKHPITLPIFLCYGLSIFAPSAQAWQMPAPLPGESHSIPIAGSTVNIKALTDQSNKAYLNGREVPVQKDGSIVEQIIVPIGKTEITLEVVDPAGLRNHYSKVINAAQEHFFLAGIVDGSLNYSDADSGLDIRR